MELIEALRNGDPNVVLSRIYKIQKEHEKRFQDILRNLQYKFEELTDFDTFEVVVKKPIKEPKRKRPAADVTRVLPNDSVCTTDLKEPLCSSTPTETSTTASSEKENCIKQPSPISETTVPVVKTPVSEFKCQIKGESVKKRVEEFEKRAAAALSASKIPILTPIKKNFITSTAPKNLSTQLAKEELAKPQIFNTKSKEERTKPQSNDGKQKEERLKPQIFNEKPKEGRVKAQIYNEKPNEERAKAQLYVEKAKEVPAKSQIYTEKAKEALVVKPRLTRNNSKILQEKNTNIKSLKERAPDPPLKKVVIKKASIDETRKKKEEAARKVAANKEALEKEKQELRQEREKEKEAKIRAIQKQKEEKLLQLKKKQLGETVTKQVENEKKPEIKNTAKSVKVLLPVSYDIEDVIDGASTDEEDNPTKQIPSWATKENRKHQLYAQAWMNKKKTVHLWFYDRRLKYPKVEELFSVGVKTRPRTSSAVWNNSSICF